MCGIFCAIGAANNVSCRLHNALETLLRRRGPNVQDKLQLDNVFLAGYVLWQQGTNAPQKQPISEGDCVLLFNGDLYNVDDEKPNTKADSAWLGEKLAQCQHDEQLLALLRQLEGPYCLVFYQRSKRSLYFARDALGRNSLIIERQEEGINLCSTSCYAKNVSSLELPPLGLYKVQADDLSVCKLHPWQALNESRRQQLIALDLAMHWQTSVQEIIAPDWLLNQTPQTASYDFYEHCNYGDYEELYKNLLQLPAVLQALQHLDGLLKSSLAARITHTVPLCRDCLEQQLTSCDHAKICVLYSGGIDCSILALLADKFVDAAQPIELINVAFESVTGHGDWNVPDRLTAQQSYAELQRLCPQRNWQLLQVNVTRAELQQQLRTHISRLIYPLQTVLDESLGCAFWFAANAAQSTARVALLGSGADELFGGYLRHRNAYRHCKALEPHERQLAVLQELELDWQRMPARNLARDDRVIADNGKTARAPFIEEHFVQFVHTLQPQQRCCFSLPEGVGDKLLLRLYGYSLGLRQAVLLKKRAIQFGSRIADKKQQAQQPSQFLQQAANTVELMECLK